jgi:hypothetical protein
MLSVANKPCMLSVVMLSVVVPIIPSAGQFTIVTVLIVQASVSMIVNYDLNTFIVQATGLMIY